MRYEKGIITGHFITHWGVPNDIRQVAARGIESLAILEFSPQKTRRTWRFATNGMSSFAQLHPDQLIKVRTEIFVCTTEKVLWIEELLAAIASYPIDYATYLSQYDTINVGFPVDRDSSCYTGILIAPPNNTEIPTIGLVGGIPFDILVHQVVGLLPKEIQFAEKYGGASLWQRLANKGALPIDCHRVSVV
jgi:hypothetical protein